MAPTANWGNWKFTYELRELSGLVISDLFYKNRLYIRKASLPVIRVRYDEFCLSREGYPAPFTDVIGDGEVVPNSDCNNQKICFTEFSWGGTKWLEAKIGAHIGEYKIHQAWQFGDNGVMKAIIQSKGIHCNSTHDHHAFWRFDFEFDNSNIQHVWVREGDPEGYPPNNVHKYLKEISVTKGTGYHLDFFAFGPNETDLKTRTFDSTTQQWGNWTTLGGRFDGDPAAVSWNDSRIDVFTLEYDKHIMHRWWNIKYGWVPSQEEDLGGSLKFGPAVCSRGPNLLDLFAVSANDNYLKVNTWDGSQWSGWQPTLEGQDTTALNSAPAVVSRGGFWNDVFALGTNNHILHASQMLLEGIPGSGATPLWQSWSDEYGPLPFKFKPAVCKRGENQIDLFGIGSDNALYYKSISPVHLVSGDWWPMGGQFNSAPSAVSWGNSRIEIFALDMNNHMQHRIWDGTSNSQFQEDLGGGFPRGAAASIRAAARHWLVTPPVKEHGVWIYPGPNDGIADHFCSFDLAARVYHPDEDHQWPYYHTVDRDFVMEMGDDEDIQNQNTVVWYVAHLHHHVEIDPVLGTPIDDDEFHTAGPILQFF